MSTIESVLLSSHEFRLQKCPHPNPSPAGEGLRNPRPVGEGGAKRRVRAALQNKVMSPLFLTAV